MTGRSRVRRKAPGSRPAWQQRRPSAKTWLLLWGISIERHTAIGVQLQDLRNVFRRLAAAEAALCRDTKVRQMIARCSHAPLCALGPVSRMQQAEINLGMRFQGQALEW